MNCRYCERPISEHPVGRETDACVAQAMEQKPKDDYSWKHRYSPLAWWQADREMRLVEDETRLYEYYTIWRAHRIPTISADAAMQVWETLPKSRELLEAEDDDARVCIYPFTDCEVGVLVAKAEDWKLAICHAALMLAAKEE